MVKTFDIKIDIEKDIYSPLQIQFEVSNSDDSVDLNFEFVQDEIPFDLTGSTVQLAVSNPSNQVFYQDVEIETPIDGKATVNLSNQGFQQAGLHVSEIYIRDVDNTIVTSPFYFKSRASIIQGEIVPTDPTDPPTIPTGDGTITWANVLNKPSFFPPEIHSHSILDVTGLQLALDSKANVGETGGGTGDAINLPIGINDVTNLETVLGSKADINHTHPEYLTSVPPEYLTSIPAEYLTQTEGDLRYQPTGTIPVHAHPEYLTSVPPEYLTEIEGDARYQASGTYLTDIPAEYLTETEGDLKYQPTGSIPEHTHPEYLTSVPAEYLTETEGDLKYQASGTIPEHTHPEYADAGHTHPEYLTSIPAEYLTETEGDLKYQASGSIPVHDHVVGDVTGLQLELDGKMDDGDAYLKTETYNKGEVYNRTEIDQMTMGDGGGSPVIVEDNLMSNSTSNALSSNQGRILDETKADINHTHPEYLTSIPAEYLTELEGDARYQATGSIPVHDHVVGDVTGLQLELDGKADVNHNHDGQYSTIMHGHSIGDIDGLSGIIDSKADINHVHTEYAPTVHSHPEYLTDVPAEYLTQSEGDLLYQPTGTIPVHDHPEYLTSVPPEYLTQTEGDALYQPTGSIPVHDHPEYLTDIPAEYLTEIEGDTKYQPKGTYLTSIPAEYLTETEGDLKYQASGTIPVHDHPEYLTDIPAEYLTETEGDTKYQVKGTYLTDIPAEYLTNAEGDALYTRIGHKHNDLYSPIGHTHPEYLTSVPPEYLTSIPAEYLTQTEGDARYQPIGAGGTLEPHSHTISDVTGLQTALDGKVDDAEMNAVANKPIASGMVPALPTVTPRYTGDMVVDTAQKRSFIANGSTVGDWERLAPTTYVDTADNFIINTLLGGMKLWKGTQLAYDGLTKDPNTLYFIVG
jgi:BppU N-terminal domain/Phage tail repeat like